MSRRTCALVAALAFALTAAAPAAAKPRQATSGLTWTACGDAAGVQCTTVDVPKDYARPKAGTISVFAARSPATDTKHRLGSLFFNFGGPGAPAAEYVEAYGTDLFTTLNTRYDIVGMDPRGTGQTSQPIDCKVNQETQGIYSKPFTTPFNLDVGALLAKDRGYVKACLDNNPGILPYVTTANVARDLDVMRAGVGDKKLNFLGFSYGTFLGATYASLFPNSYRKMVLDGPVDATSYINDPMKDLSEQTSAFERAFNRLMQACAADQTACEGFGGKDPIQAYDDLVEQADATPIPAPNFAPDPRPVDGDDINAATLGDLYNKRYWPEIVDALKAASDGDGSKIRELADGFFGNNEDGTFDPANDRYFTIGAVEQKYPRDLQTYLRAGDRAWGEYDHFSLNNGYVELNYGLYPVRPRSAFDGPFHIPAGAATPLVVATTYDPATPYRGALRLVRDLGNARLLRMKGDGHTAYQNGSPDCIDTAIEGYLLDGPLPPAGTTCKQDVPFEQPVAGYAQTQAQAKQAPAEPGATTPSTDLRGPHPHGAR